MSTNIRVKRICQFCGKEFEAKTTVTQFCGDVCAKRAYKARVKAAKIETSNKETLQVVNRPIAQIQEREFLSITQACHLLGVSRVTLWRLMRRGRLAGVKMGKRTILKRSAIDMLFEFTEN
jgi:excisionase family DNA binding protein